MKLIYIEKLQNTLKRIACDIDRKSILYEEMINLICNILFSIKKNKNTIYFIGNGGSAGIAVHMTADFLKNGGIKTHGMFDVSTITCLGNDFGYEYIFSKQLEIAAKKNDILIAISSSGNSQNIINAVEVARENECKIITFTGFKENNKLRQMGDYNVYVPSMEYGIVESIHNMILQQIVDEFVYKDN